MDQVLEPKVNDVETDVWHAGNDVRNWNSGRKGTYGWRSILASDQSGSVHLESLNKFPLQQL